MKKILSIIIAVMMVASLGCVAFAATPTISAGSVNGTPGDTVRVPVTVSGNPGFASVWLEIEHSEGLELVDIELGMIASGGVANPESGKVAGAFAHDVTGDGALFIAVFKIADDAEEGDFSVGVKVIEFYNADDENLNPGVNAGNVAVTAEPLPETNAAEREDENAIQSGGEKSEDRDEKVDEEPVDHKEDDSDEKEGNNEGEGENGEEQLVIAENPRGDKENNNGIIIAAVIVVLAVGIAVPVYYFTRKKKNEQ